MTLMKNKNFLMCCIAFNFQVGIYSTFGTIIGSFFDRLGFELEDNVWFGGSCVVCGTIGSIVIGIVLDITQRYKLILQCVLWASNVLVLLSFVVFYYKNVFWATVFLGAYGVTIIPVIPLCFSFAVELTYPISEAVSNGMMLLVSRIYATGLGFFAQYLTERNPFYCLGLFFLSSVIATFASYYIDQAFS